MRFSVFLVFWAYAQCGRTMKPTGVGPVSAPPTRTIESSDGCNRLNFCILHHSARSVKDSVFQEIFNKNFDLVEKIREKIFAPRLIHRCKCGVSPVKAEQFTPERRLRGMFQRVTNTPALGFLTPDRLTPKASNCL